MASRIDDVPSELLRTFHDIRSKIDTGYWMDLWHKWRNSIGAACGTLAIAYLCLKASRAMDRRLKRRRLRLIREEKQRQREANVDQLHRRLEVSATAEVLARRRKIVLLSFEQLRNRLQQGSLSASEVLEAYQWRALEAQDQTNCVCEFLPEAAAWAAALDARYSGNSLAGDKPLLFGIPVSVSEALEVSGHDSTLGLVSFIDQPSKDDSVLIKSLKRLGAVPFVVTNVSQCLLSMGCSNPIFGVTTNPHDPARSAGGASGGEAALIAMRGSPLGLGVDDPGGGLRAPAHWCGVCSLKPTSGRLSDIGHRSFMPASSKRLLPPGPMGPNVDSLVSFMRGLCSTDGSMFQLDPYTIPLPFDERLYSDSWLLTIGYYHTDGLLAPVPACTRAIDVAKRILESKGHRLVQVTLPFDFEELKDMLASYAAILIPDGGQSLVSQYQHDLMDDSSSHFYQFLAAPQKGPFVKRFGSKRVNKLCIAFSKNVSDQEAVWTKINQWQSKFVRFCSKRSLDCILAPALVSTPLPTRVPERMFFTLWWYAAVFNLLDCPVGVVRCTTVTSRDEQAAAAELDEVKNDRVSKEVRKAAESSVGLPVAVQCVALPFREEICLRVMEILESGSRA